MTTSTLVVKYLYDPWGKLEKVTDQRGNTVTDAESIALRNPFRYRGYYYDTDTGWYYLNSRYYDPETGRFINADGYASTGQGFVGCNMFAYCNNNPVMMKDADGIWAVSIGLSANATAALGLSETDAIVFDDNLNIGIQRSHSGIDTGHFGLLGAGGGGTFSFIWDADTIYDLEGSSTLVGGSLGAKAYAGLDLIQFPGSDVANGISINAGCGVGFDVHVIQPITHKTTTIRHETTYTFYGGSIYGIGGGTWKWTNSQAKKRGTFFKDDFGNKMYSFNGRLFCVIGKEMYEVFE